MISVDANTCLEYLKLKEKSKIEDVSDYFLQCSQDCLREGFEKLSIIQDLRSTAICGAKNYYFQDIATIHSAVA